jgi:hypothetical protein
LSPQLGLDDEEWQHRASLGRRGQCGVIMDAQIAFEPDDLKIGHAIQAIAVL